MSIRDERKQQSHQALLDAALSLTTSGHSFSSLSLRDITRPVGLVPTAFYRHFQDKEQLGLELIDQVALQLKRVLHQLKLASLFQPDADLEAHLDQFFAAVEQHPEWWMFFSAERWGGSPVLRQAIAREIDALIEDLTQDLSLMKLSQQRYAAEDLAALSHLLINLSFNWAISWVNFCISSPPASSIQQQAFKQQTMRQIQLLLTGIAHLEPISPVPDPDAKT